MELVVLGGHGTWPEAGGACTGYLLSHQGYTVWIDLGTGTMANLQLTMGLLDVDAVVVSHRHPDHLLDLFPYFYARLFHPQRPPALPLFLPPGAFDHVRALLSDQGGDQLRTVFDVAEVEPGSPFEVGPFHVETAQMRHPVPTLGMRFEADGRALFYSADTGPTDEVIRLAHHADLALSEATWIDPPDLPEPIHLSPGQAGEHAARADVARLMVTHVRWAATRREEGLDRASSAFGRPVALAEPGVRVAL